MGRFKQPGSGGMVGKGKQARNFNSTIDGFIERLAEKMTDANLGYLIAGINLAFYAAYCFWPSGQMHSYLNHCTFSVYGFNQGYVHNLLTCHFSHQSFLSVLIDSLFCWLLSQSFTQQYGALFLGRTLLLSMFMGSGLLFFYHNALSGRVPPFQGNDAIMRGIIYTFIFANPQQTFMMFPIPIQVPAYALGIVLLLLDTYFVNMSGFGGIGAAYAMKYLL